MKTVSFSRTALKDLRTVPAKDAKAIMEKLARHADGKKQDVKAMAGSHLFRLRHGDWRVMFDETADEITVLAVGHRREIYR